MPARRQRTPHMGVVGPPPWTRGGRRHTLAARRVVMPNSTGNGAPGPDDQVRALYEEAEGQLARAMEQAVSRQAFGTLLGQMTENVVAMTRIANDVADLMLRNLRLAGRQDVIRLSRQLNRTED